MSDDSPKKDYHEDFINERFNSVNKNLEVNFNSIKNTLETIENQVLKTNGRITKAEVDIKDLQLNEARHIAGSCPQAKRFTDIEKAIEEFKKTNQEDLSDYHWIKKNPKLSVAMLVGAVIIVLFSYTGFMSMKEVQATTTTNEMLNKQLIESSDLILKNQELIKKIEVEINKNNPKK